MKTKILFLVAGMMLFSTASAQYSDYRRHYWSSHERGDLIVSAGYQNFRLQAQMDTSGIDKFVGTWVNNWHYENRKRQTFIRINVCNEDISVRQKTSFKINDESPKLSYTEFFNESFNGNILNWFWRSADEDGVYDYHYAATIEEGAMKVNEKCYKGRRLLYSTNTIYYNEKDNW